MKKSTKRKFLLFLFLSIIFVTIFTFSNRRNDKENKENKPIEEQVEIRKPDKVGTNYLNNITYTKEIDKEAEKIIVEFFNVYYNSIKELIENDMTYLFLDNESNNALINQTALSLLVESRKLKPNDLKMKDVKYDLEIVNVKEKEDYLIVDVLENNIINFNFMSDIESKIYDIENTFKIKKDDDKYKIISFEKVQDFYIMIENKYKNGGKEELVKIKDNYLKQIKKDVELDKENYLEFLDKKNKPFKEVDHKYDREKASLEMKWVNKRNPDWLEFESNCQNFASYILHAGGIPYDDVGNKSTIWDERLVKKEYYTWTYVPFFREYAIKNKGFGMVATVDVNLYYAETGDVIHVGMNSPTSHALIVNKPYVKDGKVVDILVNSNTIDLENFPISAYSYPYISLIKIHGWNEK